MARRSLLSITLMLTTAWVSSLKAEESPTAEPAVDLSEFTKPDFSENFSSMSLPATETSARHEHTCADCARAPFMSDHAFDDFISPITNPVWFEDPRSLTELRGIFVNQMIPEDSPLAGDDFQMYAVQARVALSERFSIIALKDGYTTLQADGLEHEEGWADLNAGVKYVFVRDTCRRFLLSGLLAYEWSQGSREVFQGNGDGVWHFVLSTAKGFGKNHFVGAFGWHLPNNGAQESESFFYSLHLDRELWEGFYPLMELNGIHYTESGDRCPFALKEGIS